MNGSSKLRAPLNCGCSAWTAGREARPYRVVTGLCAVQAGQSPASTQTAAAIRLLLGCRFYNCHFGGHLLGFFHASYDDQAAVGNQQAAMIHGGLGSIVADGFPFAGVDIESEGDRGGFRGLAVIADSVVVVWGVGSAGEIDSARFLFQRSRACRDAIVSVTGMCWKLCPFNFRDVTLLGNFSHPAFAGRDVLGIGAARILVSAVDVDDSVADDGARVAEHRRTGNWCGLHPAIFVGVVNLNVADGIAFRV